MCDIEFRFKFNSVSIASNSNILGFLSISFGRFCRVDISNVSFDVGLCISED